MVWTGDNPEDLKQFMEDQGYYFNDEDCGLYIETLEGDHKANTGDYIIKGVKGEFYPCKEDIFKKTYVDFTEYVGTNELLVDLDSTLESIENNLKSFLPDTVHVEYLKEMLPIIRVKIRDIYGATIK